MIDVEAREGKLCELIDGVLVEKAVGFRESSIAGFLMEILGAVARAHKLGRVLTPDGTIELFPGQVRLPGVAFYPWDRFPGRRIPDDPIPPIHPDLAIEVISRTNTKGEMFGKRKVYFLAGVRLVWQVDARARTVEVYTAVDQLTTLTDADTLTGGDVLPGFAVPVAELFADGPAAG